MVKELYYTEEQTKDFNVIISMSDVKRLIIRELSEIAESKWKPLGRWGKGEIKGRQVWGVMDQNENDELYWSHFNRLNTNRTGLTHLRNKINELMILNGREERIIFKENFHLDYDYTYNVVKKMLRLTKELKDVVFNEESDFYKELISLMVDTWERGKTHTQHFVDNYKRLVPESTGIEHNDDKPGDVNDMLDGIDCTLIFGDKRRTLQVKGVTKCELRDDGVYYINVSMVLEKYRNINAFVFYPSNEGYVYIFKNNIDKITSHVENGITVFKFSPELLYKKELK
jgi:hypothetical protein